MAYKFPPLPKPLPKPMTIVSVYGWLRSDSSELAKAKLLSKNRIRGDEIAIIDSCVDAFRDYLGICRCGNPEKTERRIADLLEAYDNENYGLGNDGFEAQIKAKEKALGAKDAFGGNPHPQKKGIKENEYEKIRTGEAG